MDQILGLVCISFYVFKSLVHTEFCFFFPGFCLGRFHCTNIVVLINLFFIIFWLIYTNFDSILLSPPLGKSSQIDTQDQRLYKKNQVWFVDWTTLSILELCPCLTRSGGMASIVLWTRCSIFDGCIICSWRSCLFPFWSSLCINLLLKCMYMCLLACHISNYISEFTNVVRYILYVTWKIYNIFVDFRCTQKFNMGAWEIILQNYQKPLVWRNCCMVKSCSNVTYLILQNKTFLYWKFKIAAISTKF